MNPMEVTDRELESYCTPGSTMQISNIMAPRVSAEEGYVREGELERVWIEDGALCARFRWIAQKDLSEGVWYMASDDLLDFRAPLSNYHQAMQPDGGRFVFLPPPTEPHPQVLLVANDYHGPTGRTPLKREVVKVR